MTREEAIWYLTPIAESASLERYKEALGLALSALREKEERRWIPVTERFPESNMPVLVYCTNITIQGGYTIHIGSFDSKSSA